MPYNFMFLREHGIRKTGADKPLVIASDKPLYCTVAEALPSYGMPVLPHHAGQTHGSESVPVAEQISQAQLHRLTSIGRRFFRCMLAPVIKHV